MMSFCAAIENIQSEEKKALHKNYHSPNNIERIFQ